jgi:hypothetical protein
MNARVSFLLRYYVLKIRIRTLMMHLVLRTNLLGKTWYGAVRANPAPANRCACLSAHRCYSTQV